MLSWRKSDPHTFTYSFDRFVLLRIKFDQTRTVALAQVEGRTYRVLQGPGLAGDLYQRLEYEAGDELAGRELPPLELPEGGAAAAALSCEDLSILDRAG
jgi:hypothetical protein